MKRVVVWLLLFALVLAGGGLAVWRLVDSGDAGGTGTLRAPTAAPETSTGPEPGGQPAPDPRLQAYYDQSLAWSSCGNRECARIEVPLDYDDPEGERIELALLKVAAGRPADRVGSLVVNPGGPGAPGTSYADRAGSFFGDRIRDRFDIVGFDPRGTGTSSPVDCLGDRQLDRFIALDADPDTPSEVTAFERQLELIGTGCARRSGELAAHVSTVEAARDMDVIRAALGEDRLTYFGASYGTKLGATYADLFPDRAGRLVLDGAVDVSLSNRDLTLEQAAGFELALTAYVDDCLAEGPCFLGADREEALAEIGALLDRVDREPLPVGDRTLRVGNAFYGIVAPLYSETNWPLLTASLSRAMQGDGTGLLRLSDLYTSRGPDGTYTDNSSEAIYAINCLDDPGFTPVDEVPEEFAAFEEASPTFGRIFAWSLTGCAGLAVEPPEPREPLTAEGADPLLVIGTTRDPATPYRWAEALADQLASAVLVSRDGDGHTGYNMGNACVDEVVESYLVEGTVPDGDVDCPA
ncbi:alpha/beta hydrolase [Nocardioides donggukensis]|uniref:Alpha/beta fold hydrolase n=1 Tax=Nocardioides donggukensis TaxID=2774019 RepID=A0A927K6M8_9ACTN|nr:alpha/beta hydrolase [Nocardioides donggukensis]MBD8870906.1 alpha/beta fold hydrolase [Nocardioides donggukensis]